MGVSIQVKNMAHAVGYDFYRPKYPALTLNKASIAAQSLQSGIYDFRNLRLTILHIYARSSKDCNKNQAIDSFLVPNVRRLAALIQRLYIHVVFRHALFEPRTVHGVKDTRAPVIAAYM